MFSFTSKTDACLLPGEAMAAGLFMGRRQAAWGIMELWERFSAGKALWYVTMTCTTYQNIFADHIHHFMAKVFPDCSDAFWQINAPCCTAEMIWEWFEEHEKNVQDIYLSSKFTQSKQACLGCASPSHWGTTLQLGGLGRYAVYVLMADTRNTFRGIAECMPWRLSLALAEQEVHIKY